MAFIKSIRTTLAAAAIVAVSTGAALAEFPERTIELIHPWGPGNAMSVSQIIAKAMGEELGVDMPVIGQYTCLGTGKTDRLSSQISNRHGQQRHRYRSTERGNVPTYPRAQRTGGEVPMHRRKRV